VIDNLTYISTAKAAVTRKKGQLSIRRDSDVSPRTIDSGNASASNTQDFAQALEWLDFSDAGSSGNFQSISAVLTFSCLVEHVALLLRAST